MVINDNRMRDMNNFDEFQKELRDMNLNSNDKKILMGYTENDRPIWGDNPNIKQEEQKMETEYDRIMRELKPEINNFLFSRLPGEMTLDEFEKVSIDIYKIIFESWQKYIPPVG